MHIPHGQPLHLLELEDFMQAAEAEEIMDLKMLLRMTDFFMVVAEQEDLAAVAQEDF